jgi:hypothetical protein
MERKIGRSSYVSISNKLHSFMAKELIKITVLSKNKVFDPMDLQREFLGPECGLRLALACSGALEAISQRKGDLSRRRKLYSCRRPAYAPSRRTIWGFWKWRECACWQPRTATFQR